MKLRRLAAALAVAVAAATVVVAAPGAAQAAQTKPFTLVNSASFEEEGGVFSHVAKNSLATIFRATAAPFTDETRAAQARPLPTTLGGVRVEQEVRVPFSGPGGESGSRLEWRPLQLLFVNSNQINLVVADGFGPNVKVRVFGKFGTVALRTDVSINNDSATAIFTVNSNGTGPVGGIFFPVGEASRPTYKFVTVPGTPAPVAVNDPVARTAANGQSNVLVFYVTGLDINIRPFVRIGGVEVPAAFAGSTGEFVGVQQINVPLTPNLPAGDDLRMTVIVDEGLTPTTSEQVATVSLT